MKPRTIAALFVALLLIGTAIWFSRAREAGPSVPPPRMAERVPAQSEKPPETFSVSGQPRSGNKPSPEIGRALAMLNHNPIQFYGRVVDQHGEPVAGARVRGSVLVNNGRTVGSRKVVTESDGAGYFTIDQAEGHDLGIVIEKEGYEYRRRTSSFSYSYFEADQKRHTPDAKQPATFVLWKKQGAGALVHYERTWRFDPARALAVSLAKGTSNEPNGDMTIVVRRTPVTVRRGDHGFAWSAQVEFPSGGLVIAADSDYYNEAPESGYQRTFEYMQPAQAPSDAGQRWSAECVRQFYFRTGSGLFGCMRLLIIPVARSDSPDVSPVLVRAEVWLNPDGSRNLEFDPAQAIEPVP